MSEIAQGPDRLLSRLRAKDHRRGALKIFFGYAAGVGKTYNMLEAAHSAKNHGIDVVVGYVEPHVRAETLALLDGLEQLPVQTVLHRGVELREFDLDAALKRAPQLILVDELAHTNAPGSRHEKRYQDVEELLQAGINVYTTVNVQHLESLNDMVASITGVTVRERIPDSVFDRADQVEIADIEPEELFERLQEGKIYREPQAQRAMQNFFSAPNLTALREIALRRCADNVNLRSNSKGAKRNESAYTEDHILVHLSSSSSNARIIRAAARMAQTSKALFTALFVETPDFSDLDKDEAKRLRSNIQLAEELGAKIETVYGTDTAFQIAEFARINEVSHVVIGRNDAARKTFLSRPSLSERLASQLPQLNISIIPDAVTKTPRRIKRALRQQISLIDCLKTIGILIAASGIGAIFEYVGFEKANIITVYVLAVMVIAVTTQNRIYSLVSSLISVLIFNFLFTYPTLSFKAYGTGYPVTFVIMFLAAFLTSSLATKLKEHAKHSALTAFRTKILFDVNQSLQQAENQDEILTGTASHLNRLLKKDIVMYAVDDATLMAPRVYYAQPELAAELSYTTEHERSVALWVVKNNKPAGAGAQTLSGARCLYYPIQIAGNVYGVVGIAAGNGVLNSFDKSIVSSILGECALALENDQNARERERTAIIAQKEQLRVNLLRAISHDLRTPLTSISGNASNFLSIGDQMDDATKHQLFTDIYDDSMWLINLVENVLSVTRLEEEHPNLQISSELVSDVVEEALQHVNRRSADYHITVEHDDEFLLAKMDAKLIVQVVINLVDNAVRYTPAGSHIHIHTKPSGGYAVFSVSDDGAGVPDDAKPKVFDMFYSGSNKVVDSCRSLGIGLSLCKSIVVAHGGTITISDNHPHGAVFTFTLPMEEVVLYE